MTLLNCPHCGGSLVTDSDKDARTIPWRARFRFYTYARPDEPSHDSDSELPPDAPGAEIFYGLRAVAASMVSYAATIHGTSYLPGLMPDDVERTLRGIRPTLSRRKGSAVIRVGYDTEATFTTLPKHAPAFRVRVDVQQVKTI